MNETTNSSGLAAPALPGVGELVRGALAFFRTHFSLILGISALPIVLGIVQIFAGQGGVGIKILFWFLAFVSTFLAQLALFDVVTRQSTSISAAYKSGAHMLVPFAWVSLLVGLVAIGGTVLLFVPGLILSILLTFSTYVLFTENRRGFDALNQSWHYVSGYWWPVFWRFLFFGLIFVVLSILLTALTGGPGPQMGYKAMMAPPVSDLSKIVSLVFSSLIVVPLTVIYSYGIFNSLRQIKGGVVEEATYQKRKKNLTTFLVIGIVGIITILGLGLFFAARQLPLLLLGGLQ